MSEEAAKNPRSSRTKTLRIGKVRQHGNERKALIRDLSPTGASVQADLPAVEGERVFLSFGEYEMIKATVRWHRGGRFGIQFEEAVDLALGGPVQEEAAA